MASTSSTSVHRQLTAPESAFVGLIIGKGGANITKLKKETSCEILVSKTIPQTITIRGEKPDLALSRINGILLNATKKQKRKKTLEKSTVVDDVQEGLSTMGITPAASV